MSNISLFWKLYGSVIFFFACFYGAIFGYALYQFLEDKSWLAFIFPVLAATAMPSIFSRERRKFEVLKNYKGLTIEQIAEMPWKDREDLYREISRKWDTSHV